MNKQTKLLLEDYIADKSDIRLGILAGRKLSKSERDELKLVISDYERDKSKAREKVIDRYLSQPVNKTFPARDKHKTNKDITFKVKNNIDPAQIKIITEMDNKLAELIKTKDYEGKQQEVRDLTKTVMELKKRAGYFEKDPHAQEKIDLMMVKAVLGDWEKQGTYAYEILNGTKAKFTIVSPNHYNTTFADINRIIKDLERFSGQKARKFHITPDYSKGKKTITLVDAGSGLPPEPSIKMTNVSNGADLTNMLGSLM